MGCADVCLDMNYDGGNEFYAEKMCRARMTHECCECGEAVVVGSLYQRATGKAEGYLFSEATCGVCTEIRAAFVCGSWVFGQLWESIREELFPVWRESGAWDCLAKLTTPEAIAKANAEYREWLTDNDYEESAHA